MATIISRYKRPDFPADAGGGKRITEQQGYIPPKVQIEQFMQAGRRLADYRRQQYDFSDGADDGYDDPTRHPNYDLADASLAGDPAMVSVQAAIDEVMDKRAAEVKKDAEELSEYRRLKAQKPTEPPLE